MPFEYNPPNIIPLEHKLSEYKPHQNDLKNGYKPRAYIRDFTVFSVGDHDKGHNETPQRDHRVTKIIVHPNWSRTGLRNDIAILELTDPIQFDSVDYHVFPICLPDADVPVGTPCYITGMSMYTYVYLFI